jgi:hypothetical protein
MKRREFLLRSAGIAGAFLPGYGRAVSCPPPLVDLDNAQAATSCGTSGAAPSWFTAMGDKTWSTVAGNSGQRITDVSPEAAGLPIPPGSTGLSIVTGPYCGGAVNGTELILAANGGHVDYSGNEVYSLELKTSTPAWQRLTNPSNPVQTGTGATYSDGQLRSTHTWGRPAAGNGKFLMAMIEATYDSGYPINNGFIFNRATKTWTNLGTAVPGFSPDGQQQGGVSAYDSVSKKFYNVVGYDYGTTDGLGWTIDSNTNAKTILPLTAKNRYFRWNGIAHDLRLWLIGAPAQNVMYIVDISNPNADYVQINFTGSMPTDGAGCVYHQPSRAFLFWHGDGANIVKLSIPTNPVSGTWAFSTVAPAGSNSVVPPSVSGSQPYGRFNIVQDMGNGQSCIVLATTISGGTHVYKLPAGALT